MKPLVLGGFHGLIPHPPAKVVTVRLPGLRHNTKNLKWVCRVLGQDIWFVNGDKLRTLDAGFDGVESYTTVDYIPPREIWVEPSNREWNGYRVAKAVLMSMLMHVRRWDVRRASAAGKVLEDWLRETARTGGTGSLERESYFIWTVVLNDYMPGMDREAVDDMARQAVRQLSKFL